MNYEEHYDLSQPWNRPEGLYDVYDPYEELEEWINGDDTV